MMYFFSAIQNYSLIQRFLWHIGLKFRQFLALRNDSDKEEEVAEWALRKGRKMTEEDIEMIIDEHY